MCYEAHDGVSGCGGHGHRHETGDAHSDAAAASEDKPPGIRLEAGKGKVYEFTRGLPGDRLVEAVYHCARLEDVGRYGIGFYLNDMDPTPRAIREAVLKRDGYRCVLCGSRKDCRVHHLDSRANGGEARIERMVTLCLRHHSMCHEGLITICIDLNGKAYATDLEGRDLSVEVPLSEVLDGAHEPHGMISFEVTPDRESPEEGIEADAARRLARSDDDVLDPEGGFEDDVDEDCAARRLAAPHDDVPDAEGGVEDDGTARRLFPEVLTGQGSPSRREFLRAIRVAQSIERIPARLERDEWHISSVAGGFAPGTINKGMPRPWESSPGP